ncbi:hypothetical protein TanjilG_31591 [Lupinus angustifolius]|uniref:Uncharacterized protein n=1 Tax=Lupinus angustifolius TaxID=3871 RepID=A0A4P1RIR1_LUPAN|nr:hypothetical protein TanjilG_31591 [Lupinus angustifolius]
MVPSPAVVTVIWRSSIHGSLKHWGLGMEVWLPFSGGFGEDGVTRFIKAKDKIECVISFEGDSIKVAIWNRHKTYSVTIFTRFSFNFTA